MMRNPNQDYRFFFAGVITGSGLSLIGNVLVHFYFNPPTNTSGIVLNGIFLIIFIAVFILSGYGLWRTRPNRP